MKKFLIAFLSLLGIGYYLGYESRIFGWDYFNLGLKFDHNLQIALVLFVSLLFYVIYLIASKKIKILNPILSFIAIILISGTSFSGGFQNNTERIFNILLFGADPTFTNNSTGAIQNAINACDNSAGGTVYLPNGVYKISGPLITSDNNGNNPNSQIWIPAHSATNGHHTSIKIRGEASNQEFFDYFGSPVPTIVDGVVLRSTLTSASGTRPGIFGTAA